MGGLLVAMTTLLTDAPMSVSHIPAETPNYSISEAAHYLRLKPENVRRWIADGLAGGSARGLSFQNVLELHVLKGLRRQTGLPMQRIRQALEELSRVFETRHPLLDSRLETDGLHLFLHDGPEYLNLNRSRQLGLPQILGTYLQRIDGLESGNPVYFPFVTNESSDDPRSIQISPTIAFGRPVIAHTGISTEVIVGRFRARDSISELAEEYGISATTIEDCLRWELPRLNAA
jgi:uncharacterized protein (DUF433 family)/DNA-binding transcriptional MerR regulator